MSQVFIILMALLIVGVLAVVGIAFGLFLFVTPAEVHTTQHEPIERALPQEANPPDLAEAEITTRSL